jgi:hypothetical protein
MKPSGHETLEKKPVPRVDSNNKNSRLSAERNETKEAKCHLMPNIYFQMQLTECAAPRYVSY